jgi:hypothetical protein
VKAARLVTGWFAGFMGADVREGGGYWVGCWRELGRRGEGELGCDAAPVQAGGGIKVMWLRRGVCTLGISIASLFFFFSSSFPSLCLHRPTQTHHVPHRSHHPLHPPPPPRSLLPPALPTQLVYPRDPRPARGKVLESVALVPGAARPEVSGCARGARGVWNAGSDCAGAC